MYVIQERENSWSKKYKTVDYLPGYKTLPEARAAFEELTFQFLYRIAEEYTVTRHRAVK